MTSARHKAAEHTTRGRTASRFLVPSLAAAVLTTTVVGVSVATSSPAAPEPTVVAGDVSQHVDPLVATEQFADRTQRVSRAADRVTLEEVPEPVGHRFALAPLKLRLEPSAKARSAAVVPELAKLFITGEVRRGFAEVVRGEDVYWVTAQYLAKRKPKPEVEETEESADATTAPPVGECTAAPPSGVTSGAMAVYEAVCARFPQVTTYGGWRGDGEHVDGTAVDIMVSGELGWQIAEYLRANAAAFNLYDIIYSQRIWTADRSSEGWRYMEDRGSATANHYDHVHVKVYG